MVIASLKTITFKRIKSSLICKEVIVSIMIIALSFLFKDIPNSFHISTSEYSSAVNALNSSLVFAMFLSFFTSSNNQNIQEAQRHPAYMQPAVIFILNSIILCILSSVFPLERQWRIAVGLLSTAFILFNLHILKRLLALASAKK